VSRKKRAVGLIACAAAAAIVVSGCSSSPGTSSASSGTAAAGKPITILFVADMTGPAQAIGKAMQAGLNAVVSYLNGKGGIDGHKIITATISDNSDVTTGVSQVTKYLSTNPAPTYVFPGDVTVGTALQPLLSRDKIMAWGLGNGEKDNCYSNAAAKNCGPFFSVAGTFGIRMDEVVAYFKSKGYKKIGVIQDQRASSQSETALLQQLLPKANIQASYVTTPTSAVDLTPEMSQLKSDGVDAVWSEEVGAPVGYVLQARDKLSWTVPVIFNDSGSSSDITKLVPKSEWSDDAAELINAALNPSAKYPGRDLMLKSNPSALQSGGFGGEPLSVAAWVWEGVMLLDDAVSATHSLDATTNQKYLEAHSISDPNAAALFTTAKFTANNHVNVGMTEKDYEILPVAPIGTNGELMLVGS
jgi:ABC-type branched-subunit amino acid transport system substrate-binding protein